MNADQKIVEAAGTEVPRASENTGLECPQCGCRHLPVYYSRPKKGFILRVRTCRHCGRRVVTRERT